MHPKIPNERKLVRNPASTSSSIQWRLTMYDQQVRLARTNENSEKQIEVDPIETYDIFTCPICLDLLKHTMTTSCLHRFCRDCISNALSKNNKECPTCRKKIPSMRQLRHDAVFDQFIREWYPNQEEFDQKLLEEEMKPKEVCQFKFVIVDSDQFERTLNELSF